MPKGKKRASCNWVQNMFQSQDDVLCTLNSRQNRCRNRHPPPLNLFDFLAIKQTAFIPLLLSPSSHGVNPKCNNPQRIMWPNTHQCTIHGKPLMTHFPSLTNHSL
jgi:hypothetical protein